jgi:cation:H+ antiporter
MPSALLILAGLAGLLIGADLLVRGAAAVASRLGVRPIVVGLTVVALGTSLPELAVGVDAVRQGSPGLAVGKSATSWARPSTTSPSSSASRSWRPPPRSRSRTR